VLSLDEPAAPHIDPYLKRTGAPFGSLAELWGDETAKITVRDLLGMTSGVPDYDTASPSGRHPTDLFRAQVYANPKASYPPTTLLSEPWVKTGKLLFSPGACDRQKYYNCYSSSNYVLLGLLLANEANATSGWKSYDQYSALAGARADFYNVSFAATGPPAEYTSVHGYDVTHYNNNTGSIDVSGVSGVFGGWTAADFVADASDAASLVLDVYAPPYKLVSKPLVDQMYESSSLTGYGLSTFNLTRLTPSDVAYGHLGATYGFQSLAVYVPKYNLALTVATNIERDHQDQPADIFCSVYNYVKAILEGKPTPTCTFTPSYWHASCDCK
jgi:CubicO group peptidase (beta-lactamase class C family)